ncbi:MAG: ribonuclease catalytic domain-containing protein, partial [Polyangiales bacterium]
MAAPTTPSIAFTGRVAVHPRGFGFVTEEGDAEGARTAFVPPPLLNPLLADDVVRVEAAVGDDGRATATSLQLLERARVELVGEVVMHRGGQHLRVDREVANTDYPLDAGGLPLAQGDHALARLVGDRAVAVRRLDAPDERAVMRVVSRYAIPTEHSPEALAEVAAVLATPHALGSRRDLRAVPTVTIDAPSTRDIDDAISVLPAPSDGALRLLVSIADVSEAVREGSALDVDARDRATSVYLAGRVIPMLPESLSSDWLSLLPGTDRRCLTAELRIDTEGEVTAVDVYESVIRSWARLNYDEVADFLDRGEVSTAMEPARAVMPWFRTVSARLGLARARRGGVEVARDEAKIVLDASGEATAVE